LERLLSKCQEMSSCWKDVQLSLLSPHPCRCHSGDVTLLGDTLGSILLEFLKAHRHHASTVYQIGEKNIKNTHTHTPCYYHDHFFSPDRLACPALYNLVLSHESWDATTRSESGLSPRYTPRMTQCSSLIRFFLKCHHFDWRCGKIRCYMN